MNMEEILKKNLNGPLKRSEVIEMFDAAYTMITAMADGFDINGLGDSAGGLRAVAETYSVAKELVQNIEVLD